ncbi:ABC transporter permease [Brevibacillus sp. B_LB10_24]|uniref:ABC transporter permease n=1 Tax=Brevibacillus sp. B_LB10_24 TaxID=3380645 RepID=UPI0038BC0E04
MRFLRLVQNELMKIHSKRNSWFYYLFLVMGVIASAILMKYLISAAGEAINFVEFSHYMKMALAPFITIFAVVMGAQTITEEFKDGTIKQLLIRPASRTAVLLSKYVSIILIVLIAYAVLLFVSLLTGVVLFGTSSPGDVSFAILYKKILYDLPGMMFIMTLSFFLAVTFRGIGLAISVAIIANFIGGLLVTMLSKYAWAKYIIFANTDLTVYDPDPLISSGMQPPFAGMTLGFSLSVILAYIAVLLIVANLIFVKRDIR